MSVEPRYLTVDQCATYLGRTPGAIRKLVERHAIPSVRIAGRVQFDRERIDRWVKEETQRAA